MLSFVRLSVVVPQTQLLQLFTYSNKRTLFGSIGIFNEADTLESSLILICLISEQRIFTQSGWHKAMEIQKSGIKRGQLMWHFYKYLHKNPKCNNPESLAG